MKNKISHIFFGPDGTEVMDQMWKLSRIVATKRSKVKVGREFLDNLNDTTLKYHLQRCDIGIYDSSKHITAYELGFLNLHKLNKQGDRRFKEYFVLGGKVYLQRIKNNISGSKRVFFMRDLAIQHITGKLRTVRQKIVGTTFYYQTNGKLSKKDFKKFTDYVYDLFDKNPTWLRDKNGRPYSLDLDEEHLTHEEVVDQWEYELYPRVQSGDTKLDRKAIIAINKINLEYKKEEKRLEKIMKKLSPAERKILEEDNAKNMEKPLLWKKKSTELEDMSGFE